MDSNNLPFEVVVVGGGIAGTTFVETLASLSQTKIALISASPLLKRARVRKSQGRAIEHLDVKEVESDILSQFQNVTFFHDEVIRWNAEKQCIHTSRQRQTISYQILVICTGGRPDIIHGDPSLVIGIRDTESVNTFTRRVKDCRRVVLVGNGGIATEVVHELTNTEIVWVIKDKSISSAFFDAAAGKFLLQSSDKRRQKMIEEQRQQNQQQPDDRYDCERRQRREAKDISHRRNRITIGDENRRKSEDGDDDGDTLQDNDTSREEVKMKTSKILGAALGPDWSALQTLKGRLEGVKKVTIEYECQVTQVVSTSPSHEKQVSLPSVPHPTQITSTSPGINNGNNKEEQELERSPRCATASHDAEGEEGFPVIVYLSNGKIYAADIVVSATGVSPNVHPFACSSSCSLCDERNRDVDDSDNKDKQSLLSVAPDGGILVNEDMETSVKNVFAAGDVCTTKWSEGLEGNPCWIQMRLWTQARQMGFFAAHSVNSRLTSMRTGDPCTDHRLFFNFDCFTHVTSFFGYKVILLGLFKGQKMGSDYQILARVDEKNDKFMEVIIQEGRVKGAVLIGETDLEETFENLIINQIDVSSVQDHLLEETVDLEDFFD